MPAHPRFGVSHRFALACAFLVCLGQCAALGEPEALRAEPMDAPQMLSAVQKGYFGIVRVNLTSGTEAARHACALPPIDFQDVSRAIFEPDQSVAMKEVGGSMTWDHAWHLLQECGVMHVSHSQDGCLWDVKKMLRALYETGTSLMLQGAEPEIAYSV